MYGTKTNCDIKNHDVLLKFINTPLPPQIIMYHYDNKSENNYK